MSAKKGKFSAKAQSVLGVNRPSDMRDFLAGESRPTADPPLEASPDPIQPADVATKRVEPSRVVRKAGKPESRKAGVETPLDTKSHAGRPQHLASARGKTEREEFRFTPDLSDRLRRYCYERRTKKTRVVTQALDEFLSRAGY
jgi:hypothetical protein